jgi:hypothetical protein
MKSRSRFPFILMFVLLLGFVIVRLIELKKKHAKKLAGVMI